MLLIGSRALLHHFPELDRKPVDWDYICTFEEFQRWSRDNKPDIAHCVPLSGDKFHVRDKAGMNYEFEIAWPGTSGAKLLEALGANVEDKICPVQWLYALKMSHRYLKDSPHFLKTMRDIQFLRNQIVKRDEQLVYSEWFKQREAETYTYAHPKLDVKKDQFFTGDGVQYVYDHDSIHEAVALIEIGRDEECRDQNGVPRPILMPAYKSYMKPGSEVMTSKEKFFQVPEEFRLFGVYEESCVLALERSQIPYPETAPRKSFETALMKVCTSITSGWFREWAWENYDKVIALYEQLGEADYVRRFEDNKHLLKPYTGSAYEK